MVEDDGIIIVDDKERLTLTALLETSYPLLQDFKDKAPGTFKHSQALAAMVESVAQELDLDVTFMKVCALYHDIGKSINPDFFSENQLDEKNPHDGFTPWMSAQLITRHVGDSVNILLNDKNFPREVIEVISQHHGNDILKFFYDKDDGDYPESFRYPCKKPQTIEAAVLILCDHIEATARSHMQKGKFDGTSIIDGTINKLLDSGQLDDVSMRLGNLKKIKRSLAKELEGTYLKRISYESEEIKATKILKEKQ